MFGTTFLILSIAHVFALVFMRIFSASPPHNSHTNKYSLIIINKERERGRMAVLTELGNGESAGLGLGHNSDVCFFLLFLL